MFKQKRAELEAQLQSIEERKAQELLEIEVKVNEYKAKLINDCDMYAEADKNELTIKLDFLAELEQEQQEQQEVVIDPNDVNGNL